MGVLDRLDIQPLLVAEVIIHRGQVGPGTLANFPDRGSLESLRGEHAASRFQDPRFRGINDDCHHEIPG